MEQIFIRQSPSTKLLDFVVTSEPQWLTGVKESSDKYQGILLRAGMAFDCDFILQDSNGIYDLNGVFTWVGVDLDTNPKFKRWVDLDGNLNEFGAEGLLKERINEVAL